MNRVWFKVGSATFAVAVLGALMVHAGTTAGCGGSRAVDAEPASADVGQAATPQPSAPRREVAKPGKAGGGDETHFPASKAGPIFPRKSAPPQQAPTNQK